MHWDRPGHNPGPLLPCVPRYAGLIRVEGVCRGARQAAAALRAGVRANACIVSSISRFAVSSILNPQIDGRHAPGTIRVVNVGRSSSFASGARSRRY